MPNKNVVKRKKNDEKRKKRGWPERLRNESGRKWRNWRLP